MPLKADVAGYGDKRKWLHARTRRHGQRSSGQQQNLQRARRTLNCRHANNPSPFNKPGTVEFGEGWVVPL